MTSELGTLLSKLKPEFYVVFSKEKSREEPGEWFMTSVVFQRTGNHSGFLDGENEDKCIVAVSAGEAETLGRLTVLMLKSPERGFLQEG